MKETTFQEELDRLRWKKFPILNDGYICLVDAMGSDDAIAQAARVSYGADLRECVACGGSGTNPVQQIQGFVVCAACNGTGSTTSEKPGETRRLLRYLMSHRHSTPYEMCEVKILIRIPMDHWRQWIRHRTASVNEFSTRYKPAIDASEPTLPNQWRLQARSNKQGSDGMLEEWPADFEYFESAASAYRKNGKSPLFAMLFVDDSETRPNDALSDVDASERELLRRNYETRLALGIAGEQARKNLPLSTYTEAYWKCDLHNIFHFLGLRMEAHAQKEIRDYATTFGEQIIKPLFPLAWEAFMDYKFNAIQFSALEINAMGRIGLKSPDVYKQTDAYYSQLVEDVLKSGSKSEKLEFANKLARMFQNPVEELV